MTTEPLATIVEETLSDGSIAYNVILTDSAVKIAAIGKAGAEAIAEVLNEHASYSESVE